MNSIWAMDTQIEHREALQKDIERDVAIIGGGMAGLLTAFLLHEKGVKTVVLEAGRIGHGQTKGTTAKITSQHDVIYHKLINSVGEEQAYQYAQANQEAITAYERIITAYGISCHFVREPAFLYSTNESTALEQEAKAAESLGIPAELTLQTTLPFPVVCAMKFPDQAHFQPLEFIKSIAEPLEIYEQTLVRAVEKNTVKTDRVKIKAKHIVMASHYPFINTPGYYFMRMHQERSYLLALENALPVDGMYLGIDQDGYTFRNYRNLLIFGGGGHRTGENAKGGIYDRLRDAAKKFYPGYKEITRWSAQDCFTLDSIPYIGLFSADTPHMYVATGFRKWGMSSSMVSAMILSSMICHEEYPYAAVFSPQRFHFSSSAAQLFEDGAHAVKGLAKEIFQFPKEKADEIPSGSGSVVEFEGKKAGVYKDKEGNLFTVSTKCSHLGCQLAWNPDELSWDCPCHGSRFDTLGNVIDNPALNSIAAERPQDTF
ncbi:MAG: FAD-dependent oxidoreductase [Christensenellales bacterium]